LLLAGFSPTDFAGTAWRNLKTLSNTNRILVFFMLSREKFSRTVEPDLPVLRIRSRRN
jgi:hypothetical protein